jgi:hypothetical protein
MRTRIRELLSSIGEAHANQFVRMAQAVYQRREERRIPAHARHPLIGMADRTPIPPIP